MSTKRSLVILFLLFIIMMIIVRGRCGKGKYITIPEFHTHYDITYVVNTINWRADHVL